MRVVVPTCSYLHITCARFIFLSRSVHVVAFELAAHRSSFSNFRPSVRLRTYQCTSCLAIDIYVCFWRLFLAFTHCVHTVYTLCTHRVHTVCTHCYNNTSQMLIRLQLRQPVASRRWPMRWPTTPTAAASKRAALQPSYIWWGFTQITSRGPAPPEWSQGLA